VDTSVLSSHDDFKIIMADDPFDDAVTWDELLEEITPTYWDRPQVVDNTSDEMLSLIPSNLIASDDYLLSDDSTLGLPSWFKETASWWAQDKITDKEFKKNVEYLVKEGVVQPHTSMVFQELINEVESSANLKTQIITNLAKVETSTKEPVNNESSSNTNVYTIVKEKIPINTDSIQGLVDYVDAMVESKNMIQKDGSRLVNNLNSAMTNFDTGKTNNGCNNLENYFTVVNYFVDSKKMDESTAQILINAGETVKPGFCK